MYKVKTRRYGELIVDLPPTGHKGFGLWDYYYDAAIDDLIQDGYNHIGFAHNELLDRINNQFQEFVGYPLPKANYYKYGQNR